MAAHRLNRRHVLCAVLAVVATGMAYSFLWAPLVRHGSFWVIPGDFWDTLRGASLIGWGGGSLLYASGTALVAFPGVTYLFAPVAMVSGALGLTDSFPPYFLPHPTEWLLAGPIELFIGALVLFPLDDLGARLGISARRRALLLWAEAVLIWPVVAIWGHPEDLLAVGLGIYGLMSAMDRNWLRSALWFGAATAFQPMVLLLVPIALTYVPWRKLLRFVAVVGAPSALLLSAPLIRQWGPTVHALVDQPNYPSIDHPSPWLALAPVIGHATVGGRVTVRHGPHGLVASTAPVHSALVVAAGPGRLLAVAAAIGIGVWVVRRRPSEPVVFWLAALALSLRCVFESVLDPYYMVPALALSLVVAASSGTARTVLVALAAAACTWWSYRRVGEWAYYLPVVATLALAWVAGWPRGVANSCHTSDQY